MRRLLCVCLVLMMALALVPSAVAEQKPQIHVLAVDYTEENAGLFDAFEAANNCEVVLVPVKSEEFLAYFTVVANGGAQVDVIDINGQDVRGLSQKGMLVDLTGKVDYLDRFYDAAMKPFQIDGGLYAIPNMDGTSMAMFYNKKLFEQAGAKVPTTWEELEAAKAAFDKIGVGTLIHCGGVTYMWPSWFFATLRQATGNNAVERTFAALKGEAKFTDPDFVEAMAILERLGKEVIFVDGVNAYDRESSVQAFIDGKVAMIYTGIWDLGSFRSAGLDADTLGIMPLPKFSENATFNLSYVTGAASGCALSIYKDTTNMDLSLKLLDYLTQTQQMSDYRFKFRLPEDIVGSVYPPIKEFQAPEGTVADALAPQITEMVGNADVWLDWYWPSGVTESFKEMIQAVVGGQIDAQGAMETIQQTYDDLVADGYVFS